MSMAALLIGVRDTLRTALAPAIPGGRVTHVSKYIDIRPGGRPINMLGEWFAAVDEQAVRSTERSSLREDLSLTVTLTHRQTVFAPDRTQGVYLDTAHGLDVLERLTIAAIHGSHAVRQAANQAAELPGVMTGDQFIAPLYYTGRTATRSESGEWIGAEPDAQAFLVRSLSFGGAIRIQSLDIMH